jgi:hypothetical protein
MLSYSWCNDKAGHHLNVLAQDLVGTKVRGVSDQVETFMPRTLALLFSIVEPVRNNWGVLGASSMITLSSRTSVVIVVKFSSPMLYEVQCRSPLLGRDTPTMSQC